MARRNERLPIILGMSPPTKVVTVMRTRKPLDGYACFIQYADCSDDVKSGEEVSITDMRAQPTGTACWLHFTNADIMRKFGQMLIDVADGKHIKR